MEKIRVVFVTITADRAEELAAQLVKKRYAACVNVVPAVKSFYWGDSQVEQADESLIIIKTTEFKIEELIKFVRSVHPYDVPEVITLPVAEGLPDYINWVIEETGKVCS